MTSEWTDISLSYLADINPKRAIAKGSIAKFIEMAALPTSGRDIKKHDVSLRQFASGGAKFRNGDTLLARITPCLENGKTALVDCLEGQECGFGSTEFIVLGPKDDDDSQFLYYLVRSDEFRAYAIARMEGTSGRQRVPNSAVAGYRFLCPPRSERMEIGSTLGCIDDQITLLRQTNITLEAIVQALFKSWFVDFDPVHANAGSQASDLSPEMQALFPSTFTDSSQGLIPEGWTVRTIGEVIETVGGATPDTKNQEFWSPPEISWTSPKDLSGLNAPVLLATERKISRKGLSKISSGLLPEGTLLMSSRAPIGYLAISQVPVAINQGYIAMLPGGELPPLFMLFWCRQNMKTIENRANGSTFMEISKKAFRPIELVVPVEKIINEFMDKVEPLFELLVENEKQIQTLSTLRDTMMSRMLIGRLRVPETE
ncbi:restriction endonuclease subunit S [Pseudomonas aeruginosa]|uniref:restriction endonuclease subunit S n=1 Tax=Pseudomonas aeruginosa TaxID=287 RepID=UPI0009A89095|nr:restriction endonuclease subunit S [Pseudomonas aeruginosa]SPY49403.1 HsdS protein [Pseudomonas aeruginosa]